VTPPASNTRTPSQKRTASRTCLTQYSAEHASSGDNNAPVTFDTIGIDDGEPKDALEDGEPKEALEEKPFKEKVLRVSKSSSNIGSIKYE
jgi:hypothetical protein